MMYFIVTLLLTSTFASAIEYKVTRNKQWTQIGILNAPIPLEILEKNLPSGISNTLIASLQIQENKKTIAISNLKVKVIFDLWDEVFTLYINEDSNSKVLKLTKLNEVLDHLKTYSFNYSNLPTYQSTAKYSLKFQLILDPISKEKQAKIKTWLAENRVNMPNSVSSKINTEKDTSPTINNSGVFNTLLDNELQKDNNDGYWKNITVFENISGKDLFGEK